MWLNIMWLMGVWLAQMWLTTYSVGINFQLKLQTLVARNHLAALMLWLCGHGATLWRDPVACPNCDAESLPWLNTKVQHYHSK
jgi:hypothetical protein